MPNVSTASYLGGSLRKAWRALSGKNVREINKNIRGFKDLIEQEIKANPGNAGQLLDRFQKETAHLNLLKHKQQLATAATAGGVLVPMGTAAVRGKNVGKMEREWANYNAGGDIVGGLQEFNYDPSQYHEYPKQASASTQVSASKQASASVDAWDAELCVGEGFNGSATPKTAGIGTDEFISTETQSPDVVSSDTVDGRVPPNIPESTNTPDSNRYDDYTDYYDYQEYVNTEGHPDRENHPVFADNPDTSYAPNVTASDTVQKMASVEEYASVLGLDAETRNVIRRMQAEETFGVKTAAAAVPPGSTMLGTAILAAVGSKAAYELARAAQKPHDIRPMYIK